MLRRCTFQSFCVVIAIATGVVSNRATADGIVVPPRNYNGSLEEIAQEAIIIFHSSEQPGEATEDLILKINVHGDAPNFAWIVPFPSEPKIAKEDAKLFKEIFDYVEAKQFASRRKSKNFGGKTAAKQDSADDEKVAVISRKVVGDYDIAVVKEKQEGGLNPWLKENGYQALDDAEETLAFYRDKNYVFACIKVDSKVLASERSVESHPLRFTFKTGGRDGAYFPMKLTGLQSEPFDVNLYVFYRFWLNDNLSPYGYEHRGFNRRYRDWDSDQCVANGGKGYSLPQRDPFLASQSHLLVETKKLFQKLHPGAKYYLTNIQANNLLPEAVREWTDDLWMFPYYTNRNMIPHDARPGGAAHAAYADIAMQLPSLKPSSSPGRVSLPRTIGALAAVLIVIVIGAIIVRKKTHA